MAPATLPELSRALQRMSSSRACGDGGITVQMLRLTFPVIGPHLLHLVNKSIVSGELPRDWKLAVVTPLFKSGSVSEPSNYRPVSILPVISKLPERIMCTQLMSYLLSHHVLTHHQHGFRPGHSTGAAMLDVVEHLTDNIANKLITSLTTADTSKAFDSVEHCRLLEKLGWYGVDQHWFDNWMRGRRQRVGRDITPDRPITHGVVQGSVLGPVLFLIFINALPVYVDDEETKIVIYANDVQFLHSGDPSNIIEMQNRVENTLVRAQSWFNQNRLKINPTKTDIIVVLSRQRRDEITMKINFEGASITNSETSKILGIALDQNLSWKAHVSAVIHQQ